MHDPYAPPLIRLSIEAVGGGLFKVTTPDSGATLVDRTRQPIKAAAAALTILGWGPRVLLQFTCPISTVKDYELGQEPKVERAPTRLRSQPVARLARCTRGPGRPHIATTRTTAHRP